MKTSPVLNPQVCSAPESMSPHVITELPVLVIFPHNRCNCRCLMCDIWKIRQVREITTGDIEPHLESLRALKVRWIVFSGGEPLLHSSLPALSEIFREEGIRVTLLTAGLLLEPKAAMVADHFDDIIVSLDGPPEVHDRIRGVPKAFERLARGVAAVRGIRPGMVIQGRCTVQKANRRHLRGTVRAARKIKLDSISFLAADLASEAFNRPGGWSVDQQKHVALDSHEIEELGAEIESLITEFTEDIHNAFIAETPEKLRRLVLNYLAHNDLALPVAPRCNAPWVSAVIEASGDLRPCFFHPPLGNIHDSPLLAILNSEGSLRFRDELDIAKNPVCRRCVCSLYIPGASNHRV